MAQDTVMSFLYGLVSWNKQNLRLSKPLREVDFLFVAEEHRIYLAGKAALYSRGEIYVTN